MSKSRQHQSNEWSRRNILRAGVAGGIGSLAMPGVATTVNASNNNEESLEEDLKTLFAIYANNEDRILAEVERIGIPIIEELLNLHKFPFHSTKNLLKETNLKVYSLIEDAAPTAFIQFEWKSAGGKCTLSSNQKWIPHTHALPMMVTRRM